MASNVKQRIFPSCRLLVVMVTSLSIAIVHGLYLNSFNFALIWMVKARNVDTNATVMNSTVCGQNASAKMDINYDESKFNWSPSAQGFLISGFSCGAVISVIPLAVLADKIGPRMVLLPAMLVSTVSTLLTPTAARFGGIAAVFLCRFVNGICGACSWPCTTRTVQNWAMASGRLLMVGIVSSGFQVGQFLANFLGGYICSYCGWSYIFYIYGCIGIVQFVAATLLYTSHPEENRFISQSELAAVCSERNRSAEILNGECKPSPDPIPWASLLTSLPVWATVAGLTASVNLQFFINSFMPIYFHKAFRANAVLDGIHTALPPLVCVFGRPLAGQISEFCTMKNVIKDATISAKLFETVGLGATAFVIYFINLLTCGEEGFAALILTLQAMCGVFIIGGHNRCQVALAPNFTGIITGMGCLVAYITTIGTPYVTRALTPTGTIEEWRMVFGITISFIAFCNIFFILFASAKPQMWAIRLTDG